MIHFINLSPTGDLAKIAVVQLGGEIGNKGSAGADDSVGNLII